MTALPVAQHPASVEHYIRHGWSLVPIPSGTKGPQHTGWNKRESALTSHTQLPPGWGIGLAHAYSGTMAVDVDDWDRATVELAKHGIDLNALYSAPDAVVVDSGRQGHGKLLYAMPFGLALPSKKLVDSRPDGTRYNYLDLRCATANGLTVQDVLPPSMHPDTGQPYRWAGMGHWTRLPLIPAPLLTLWNSLIEQDQHVNSTMVQVDVSWGEVTDALSHISPDCSRDEWVQVGMALHHAGTGKGQVDQAFTLWCDWSRPSHKYPGEREMVVQWRSFSATKGTTVKMGTLFRMARESGWPGVVLDASSLFQGVEPKTPAQITLDLRPPPPELDLSLVPQVMREHALGVAEGVGCDPLIPLFAGIVAVSGALDARSRLELKQGYRVPPVIWAMTIGDPADKKTPGSKMMFRVFQTLEKEDEPRYRQAMQTFEALEMRHELAKKAFMDAAKDPDLMLSGQIPQGYGEPPVKPVKLKVVTIDSTSQKLVRQCADQPRGLLLHLDEMLSWARKVVDKHSGETRSAWTQSYEAERYEMDRVGAGTINAENYAVSMYGNLQPRVFAEVVKAMSDDGLIQRFIPIVVRHDLRSKGHPNPAHMVSEQRYEMMIRTVFGLPAMTYTLSPAAADLFGRFQDWYEAKLKDERLLRSGPVFITAFGKVEGMLGRLVLLWHVMSEPFSAQVSAHTMQQVIDMVQQYVIPSQRYAFDGELGGFSSFDQWVGEYVIQYADQDSLKLSDIRRSARRQLEGVSHWGQIDMILGAMHVLEQAHWVARIDDGGDKDQAHWVINGGLKDVFADHRRQVIEAKQRRIDEIYRLSTKGKPKVHGSDETT